MFTALSNAAPVPLRADVHERPLLTGPAAAAATLAGGVSGGAADGSLHFQLRVEHPVYREVRQRGPD